MKTLLLTSLLLVTACGGGTPTPAPDKAGSDRKVHSPQALDAQIEVCSNAAQLSDSENKDVKAYLTSEYYKFE